MPKLIRVTTSPIAFKYLLKGQMKFMSENGFDVLMISSEGPEVKDVLANEQSPHVGVEMTRAITPLKDIKSINSLIKIFKRERPDIVHSHTPKAGLLSMIAARLAGVPIRLHSNSGTPLATAKGFKKLIFTATEKLTAANATMILPNSPSLMQFLAASNVCSPSKMMLVGKGSTNGIDTNFFSKEAIPADKIMDLKNQVGYDPGKFYFLFAGRIMTSKGVVELIAAYSALQKKYPHAELILAGNIETHMDLVPKEILATIEENEGIHLLGWIDDIRIPMAVSDCLVHPSHREGFPNVLLQAGALDLPVICSDCMGNVDIISHNTTGLVFPVLNSNELQLRMEEAITNYPKMQQMSNALKTNTITHFSRSSVQSNILSLYRKLLSQK